MESVQRVSVQKYNTCIVFHAEGAAKLRALFPNSVLNLGTDKTSARTQGIAAACFPAKKCTSMGGNQT